MKLRLLAVSLASVTLAGAAVDTNHLAKVYDEGIQLYWKGKMKDAALKMAEVVDGSPLRGPGNRAAYMMSTLQAKMSSNENAAFQAELRKTRPVMSAFYEARMGITNAPLDESFARMVEFAAMAPTPVWRDAALDSLLSADWPDEIISTRLQAAAVWEELLQEQQTPEPHPRLQRLQGQLMRQYVTRADLTKQIALSERILRSQSTPAGVVDLVKLLRQAGQHAEAYACYTNALSRADDPGLLGSLMVRALTELKDTATARTSMEAARARAGATNIPLLIAESYLLEASWDVRGARRVLSDRDHPELKKALHELNQRQPHRYELEWNVDVACARSVVADAQGDALVSRCRDTLFAGAITRVKRNGDVEPDLILLGGTMTYPPHIFSHQMPLAILPGGSLLVGSSIFASSGEWLRNVDMSRDLSMPYFGTSLAVSPTEGIVVATPRHGLTRFTLEGEPIFKNREGDRLGHEFCGVVWQGTNIMVVLDQSAVIYDNQGVRLRALPFSISAEMKEPPMHFFGAPGGQICQDDAGLLYLTSPRVGGVRIYDPGNRYLTQISVGNARASAAAPDGTVYVLHDSQLACFAPKDGGARALLRPVEQEQPKAATEPAQAR